MSVDIGKIDAVRADAASWITSILSNFGVSPAQAPIIARMIVDGCGLVAVDPALVEAVRKAHAYDVDGYARMARDAGSSGDDAFLRTAATGQREVAIRSARLALADAVLAQLGGAR